METIRRRKMCVYMLRIKQKKKFLKNNKVEKKYKEHHNTCSNNDEQHHPYEGNIHTTHALKDIVDFSLFYSADVLNTLYDYLILAGSSRAERRLHKKAFRSFEIMCRLKREIDYVDKNTDKLQHHFINEPCLGSLLNENQERQVIPCGNYIESIEIYIEKAREYLRLCQSKYERRMHKKKLKFFSALLYLRSNAPYQ